jgi:hypothetical protein
MCHDVQGTQENCNVMCTFCANILWKALTLWASSSDDIFLAEKQWDAAL